MHIYIHTSMHSLIHAYKRSKYNAQSQNLLKAISFYEQTGEETVYKLNRYKKRPCTNSTGRPTGKVRVQTQQVQEKSMYKLNRCRKSPCTNSTGTGKVCVQTQQVQEKSMYKLNRYRKSPCTTMGQVRVISAKFFLTSRVKAG